MAVLFSLMLQEKVGPQVVKRAEEEEESLRHFALRLLSPFSLSFETR